MFTMLVLSGFFEKSKAKGSRQSQHHAHQVCGALPQGTMTCHSSSACCVWRTHSKQARQHSPTAPLQWICWAVAGRSAAAGIVLYLSLKDARCAPIITTTITTTTNNNKPPTLRCTMSACLQASGTKWSTAIETQLCYEIKTFLLAGHETSAAMLMWSVYELTKNSTARQRVRSLNLLCLHPCIAGAAPASLAGLHVLCAQAPARCVRACSPLTYCSTPGQVVAKCLCPVMHRVMHVSRTTLSLE